MYLSPTLFWLGQYSFVIFWYVMWNQFICQRIDLFDWQLLYYNVRYDIGTMLWFDFIWCTWHLILIWDGISNGECEGTQLFPKYTLRDMSLLLKGNNVCVFSQNKNNHIQLTYQSFVFASTNKNHVNVFEEPFWWEVIDLNVDCWFYFPLLWLYFYFNYKRNNQHFHHLSIT